MKKIILTLSLVLFCTAINFAQNFEGIAYYKTQRNVELKIDSTNVNTEMQEQIQAQLRKQFQKEYSLSFNNKESLYKEEEKLDAPEPVASNGIKIMVAGNTDVLYRNLKEKNYINQTEILGKIFLIEDTLAKQDWKLEKETKNIGEYTCFKATLTEEITDKTFSNDTDEVVENKKTRVTTAWYTPQIPVGHGPGDYWGLPGLVLEINDGDQSILCSKIVLNPENFKKIEAPSNGKKVSQEEYNEISDKKNKEMMEKMRDNSSRKDGNSFRIEIRG